MTDQKYTRGGQPVGGSYTKSGGGGYSYTVGGQPLGSYTVGGQASAPQSHIPGARLDFQHSIQQHAALPQQHDGGLFGNLITQAGQLIGQVPNAIVHLPGTLIHTFGPAGVKEDTGIGFLDAPFHWLGVHGHGHATSDPQSLIGQTYMPVAQDAHALKKGDWHYFEQHPLNPILDVASVLSVGGVGALKVAEAGRLGEYAKTIATTERLIKSGDNAEALNQARTLQGRIRQRLYDNWRMKEGTADLPVVGANTTIKNILTRRANNDTIRMNLPVRVFQQLTAKLTPAERTAVHLLAEPVPYTDRVAAYEARRLELIASNGKRAKRLLSRPPLTRARAPKGLRSVDSYLALIKDPAVRAAVEHPSDALREAVWSAYNLEQKAGNTLKEAGAITQETRDKRVQLPADVLTPPEPPPPDAAPAVPRAPTGPPPPTHGAAPPWVGAPMRPPSVLEGAPHTFTVRVQRNFYSDYIEKGLPEGVVSKARKPHGNTVEVTMNEKGLDHILAAARKDGKSSALATIRKLEGQRAKIDEARARAGRKLQWRRDAQTGSSHVPGSDYHVDPIHSTGEWEAKKGDTGLGVYPELAHAKDRVERHAEDLRNQEIRAERAKIEATHAGTGLSAESFTEQPKPSAPPAAVDLSPLEQRINELGVNLAKAERRLAQTHDPEERMKLHSLIEQGRVKANHLIEEWATNLRGAQEHDLPPMGGGSLGYIHNVHDPTGKLGLPPNFRFPHTRKGVAAGDFIPRGVERALGKNRLPSQLRHNEGILLRDALFLTDPEHVYVSDYLSTMRWASLNNLQRRSLLPISQELRLEDAHTGYKKPGWWYFRPSFDHKTTVPVPREVKFGEALHQDRMTLDSEYGYKNLKERASHIVDEASFEKLMTPEEQVAYRKGKAEMTPDQRDAYNLETMKRLGIRQVPPAFGKDFSKEFGGTSRAERLFIDKPLDVWRMITLNYRPAWAVNNFVGNALMGFARYGLPGAAWYLRVLLTTERGEDKIIRLWNWTKDKPGLRNRYAEAFRTVGIHIPTRKRVIGEAFRENAPWVEQAGLYGTQSRIRHSGVYSGYGEATIAKIRDNPALRAAGLTARAVTLPLRAVSHGIVKAEVLLAENTSREAAMMVELGPDLARVRDAARLAGEANLSWAEAMRRLDPKSVELATQRMEDFLGNFNDLSHAERRWMRKVVPFYSWFKVITKATAKYAARYPGRVLLLKNMEQALAPDGEQYLPTWLQGSVMIGGPDRQGTQTLLSTQGLNPYETLPQLAESGPGGLQSPFLSGLVTGESARVPAFGSLQDYYGTGATNKAGWPGFLERAGGSFLGELAPVRLAQQETQPYKGKLYRPKTYSAGPVSVNDWLLQYLGVPIRHVNTAEARHERGLR